MARKPRNFQWVGFTDEQVHDLDLLDRVGNNAWARNSQTEALMPDFILKLDRSIGHDRVKQAMADIGYTDQALHMLDRWHSKAATGKFGR